MKFLRRITKCGFAQKETPFAGRKPEDAIFGGVPFFIYYTLHPFVRQIFLGIFSAIFYE